MVKSIQENKGVETMVSLEESEEILKEYLQEATNRMRNDDSKSPN